MLLADIEEMIGGGLVGSSIGVIFSLVLMVLIGQTRLAKKVDKILENQNAGDDTASPDSE
jgi:hypothetical protein